LNADPTSRFFSGLAGSLRDLHKKNELQLDANNFSLLVRIFGILGVPNDDRRTIDNPRFKENPRGKVEYHPQGLAMVLSYFHGGCFCHYFQNNQ
jgi:hypothetical protein